MNYQECLDYLYSQLPMFQRVGAPALKYDLSNTVALMSALGDPHLKFPAVHIAGTNGKGSSAHAISAILTSAGFTTGLFTSPHLSSFAERMRIDGTPAAEAIVTDFVNHHQNLIERIKPSFFEMTFAMAMSYFADSEVDIAIIETGLGGRLDSTNVIQPEVCLITSIGLDHTELLGDTLDKIASEKAGIIKASVPVVIGADQPDILHVFADAANKQRAPLHQSLDIEISNIQAERTAVSVDVFYHDQHRFKDLKLDVPARYFLKNIPGVIKTIDCLVDLGWKITEEDIASGLSNVQSKSGLKGRFQVLQEAPLTVADISHNLPGIIELVNQLMHIKYDRLHIVFGAVRDKKLDQMLKTLDKTGGKFYFTQSGVPRALPSLELQDLAHSLNIKGDSYSNVNEALAHIRDFADSNDMILICGSTFVVAEIEGL
ncbi:MAG: folylpolyglutamate synthase/dihydrofolate synthase family protein [Cyclobacteriaceae bacterium]|uniref:bifunctional folylpolyglutamate synthase/dihydrofolate synthase n=1 Tax=Nonlabens ulvanivorans TaxID=906888 RepID=UPI0032702A6E